MNPPITSLPNVSCWHFSELSARPLDVRYCGYFRG